MSETDLNELEGHQTLMFGNTPFNVQQSVQAAEGSVTIPGSVDAQLNQVGQSFVNDAPSNLSFDLPFGLGKLFHLPGERR